MSPSGDRPRCTNGSVQRDSSDLEFMKWRMKGPGYAFRRAAKQLIRSPHAAATAESSWLNWTTFYKYVSVFLRGDVSCGKEPRQRGN